MHFSARTLVGLSAFVASCAAQNYTLDTVYDATNFFTEFNFFTEPDPTLGFVQYVDGQTAMGEGLAGIKDGAIHMGVDSQTVNPPNGRKSVRVTSNKAFNHGLFIADIAHMPSNTCGAWPAYWMFGPDWPNRGEIDIIEGVNTQTANLVTLHTSPGCVMTNEGAAQDTVFKEADCNTGVGCGQQTADNQSYGNGFNAIGGGIFVTSWTSQDISVWFFPRTGIPLDITAGTPNPANWGTPAAKFNGGPSCNIDERFRDNNIIFNITFCGVFAGAQPIWDGNAECKALASTCDEYAAGHPEAYVDAFWTVNSVKVYQQGGSESGSGSGGEQQVLGKRVKVPRPFMV